MKVKVGEFNSRPLVVSSDENEVKYPELLVSTDAAGEKILDIKQREAEDLISILLKKEEDKEENPFPIPYNAVCLEPQRYAGISYISTGTGNICYFHDFWANEEYGGEYIVPQSTSLYYSSADGGKMSVLYNITKIVFSSKIPEDAISISGGGVACFLVVGY